MRIGERTKLTPPMIAEAWGIDVAKVHGWIRAGELRAIDASNTRGRKPRFLIDVADLADFEARRAIVPPPPRAKRRSRRDINAGSFY